MGFFQSIGFVNSFLKFFNRLLRAEERAKDREAGANEQKSKDYAAERKAMEKGDEIASKIRTGDDASALFKRLRGSR